MSYPFGTVLLMPVHFTDGSGVKPRPVVVIRDGSDDDMLVAPVTSQAPRTDADVCIEE